MPTPRSKSPWGKQDPVSYSQSLLWQITREYYASAGHEAWHLGAVPSGITTTPHMARRYAFVVRAWLQYVRKISPTIERVHIVELGSGTGRFGFHFLRELARLTRRDSLPQVRYVMTDFNANSIALLRAKPELQPFIEHGTLDFAELDLAKPGPLTLAISGARIDGGQGPICFIANYVFDTLPGDAFLFEGGVLQEWLLGIDGGDDVAKLGETRVLKPIEQPHYADPELEALLRAHAIEDGHSFVFPTAGITALRGLNELAGGQALWLIADKAITHPQFASRDAPELERHGGCISVSVDFFSLGNFAVRRGGLAMTGTPLASLCNLILAFGADADDLSEVVFAFEQHLLGEASSGDVHRLLGLSAVTSAPNVELAAIAIELSCGDPSLFHNFFPKLLPALASGANMRPHVRTMFLRQLQAVEQNLYWIGDKSVDVSLELGAVHALLGDGIAAMRNFTRSLSQGANPLSASLAAVSVAVESGEHDLARMLLEKVSGLPVPEEQRAAVESLLAQIQQKLRPPAPGLK